MAQILILHPDLKAHQLESLENGVFDTKEFNEFGESFRLQFPFIIDEASKQFPGDFDWWATSVASRNTYQSWLMLNLSYYFYAVEKLKKTKVDKVICFSKALRTALGLYANKLGLKCDIYFVPSEYHRTQTSFFRHVFRVSRFLTYHWVQHFLALFSKKPKLTTPLRLADVTIIKDSFQQANFTDRCSETLWIEVGCICRCFVFRLSPRLMKQIRKNPIPFLLKEDSLR